MKASIRTLIVDDEPLARERVRNLLLEEEDIEIIGECVDGAEAVAAINSERPDLVFLDVQMPYVNGFEALKSVDVQKLPHIIFVTAFDEFALQAFEINAIDYLLKPFDKPRFTEALARARKWIGESANSVGTRAEIQQLIKSSDAESAALTRIAVRSSGQIRFLKVAEVDYIESEGNYAKIHAGGETHTIKETLRNFEGRLDKRMFFRCHRSIIVNVDRIDRIEKWFQGDYCVILTDGSRLPLSRRRYRDLNDILGA